MFVLNIHGLKLQIDSFAGEPSAEDQARKAIENINSYLGRLEGSPQLFIPNPKALLVTTTVVEDGIEGEAKEIRSEPGDLHGEDSKYPKSDWQYEVSNGDTRLGYWDWVSHQKESEVKL